VKRREYYEADSDDIEAQCFLAEGYINEHFAAAIRAILSGK
jgi:hypothetical protein